MTEWVRKKSFHLCVGEFFLFSVRNFFFSTRALSLERKPDEGATVWREPEEKVPIGIGILYSSRAESISLRSRARIGTHRASFAPEYACAECAALELCAAAPAESASPRDNEQKS